MKPYTTTNLQASILWWSKNGSFNTALYLRILTAKLNTIGKDQRL